MVLGFDTSNYTTSVAISDGVGGKNCSRLLDVRPGELGLRQSDALFAHVKRLPELARALFAEYPGAEISAIGASTRPRAVEGSYMPCFLAGQSTAETMAAALWSAGRMELMDVPHLAWHLSGGTTELLLITPEGKNVHAEKLGGTSDISAGQLIDRTGKLLGLQFPAGKALDALSRESDAKEDFRVKVNGLTFSFSGLQNKVEGYHAAGHGAVETARYALRSVIGCILRTTEAARKAYPGLPVVFSGGVASNAMLREACAGTDAVFAQPQFSTDNAMGVAILTARLEGLDGAANS